MAAGFWRSMSEGIYMETKKDSLLFKFAVIFIIFTLVTLLMSGVNTYLNQTRSYKEQSENNLQQLAKYLQALIVADGENFLNYQNYFFKHRDRMFIPYDFAGDYQPEKKHFEKLFAEKYPNKTLGVDVKFDDMPEEIQLAFATYYHEYWHNTFEKARDSFGLKYAYYLIPGKEKLHMIWMIDMLRELKVVDEVEYIDLGVDVLEPLDEHQKMWEAWETGREPEGYDTYDNEFGKTYAYYMPLNIGGKTVGVIGTEVEIDRVNEEILRLTLEQFAGMGIILAICVLTLLIYINKNYISKLSHLQLNVKEYSQKKNPEIVTKIEEDAGDRKDEIAALSMQIAAMILELENYMNSLVNIAQELSTTKEKAEKMHELAHVDALTGVNNKNSYDTAMGQLDWKIEDGNAEFAIAMIDLNFLKRINDTYGHEQGNTAIQRLCHMLKGIFKNSPIFRIGGDEFVVILEGEDFLIADKLVDEFNAELERFAADPTLEPWEKISASLGMAIYDKLSDSSAANVFKRADKAMYIRKRAMKAVRD